MKRVCFKMLAVLCLLCVGCQGRKAILAIEDGIFSDSLAAVCLPEEYKFYSYLGDGLCVVSPFDSQTTDSLGIYQLFGEDKGLILPFGCSYIDSIQGTKQYVLLRKNGHTSFWDVNQRRDVLDIDSLSVTDFVVDRFLTYSSGIPVWIGYTSPYVYTVLVWGNGEYRLIHGEENIRMDGKEVVMERGVEEYRFSAERLKESLDSLYRINADCVQMVTRTDTVSDRGNICGTLRFRIAYPTGNISHCLSVKQWLTTEAMGQASTAYEKCRSLTPFVEGEKLADACVSAYARYCRDMADGESLGELYNRLSFTLVPCWEKEHLLTYFAATDSYGGGAHGMYTQSYTSFDTKADRRLTFEDIVLPEARQRVRLLLLEKIKQHFQESVKGNDDLTEVDCLHSLIDVDAVEQKFGSSTSPEAVDYMKSHFELNDPGLMPAGLVFAYDPYEIDSFAGGNKFFVIPYTELKGCLRPDLEQLCLPDQR